MQVTILLLFVVVGILMRSISLERYIVGEGYGWRPAPDPAYYQDWAKTVKLKAGDELGKTLTSPNLFFITVVSGLTRNLFKYLNTSIFGP